VPLGVSRPSETQARPRLLTEPCYAVASAGCIRPSGSVGAAVGCPRTRRAAWWTPITDGYSVCWLRPLSGQRQAINRRPRREPPRTELGRRQRPAVDRSHAVHAGMLHGGCRRLEEREMPQQLLERSRSVDRGSHGLGRDPLSGIEFDTRHAAPNGEDLNRAPAEQQFPPAFSSPQTTAATSLSKPPRQQ
jgi:hypothetical protein